MQKTIELKKCARCGEVKSVEEFYRYLDGYQAYCKVCQREYNLERQAEIELLEQKQQEVAQKEIVLRIQNSRVIKAGESMRLYLYDTQVNMDDIANLNSLVEYARKV